MTSKQTYISIYAALAIIMPGVVAAINVAVDPWGYFDTKLISGFNALKPELPSYERVVEAHRLSTLQPLGLILGASNSDVGLDPEHPAWSVDVVFNAATGQCSISLVYRLLQQAITFQIPKQIVLGLDIGMFNPARQQDKGISESSFAVTKSGTRNRDYLALNHYANAFSFSMLRASLGVIAANRKVNIDVENYRPQLTATGMMNPESFPTNAWKTYRYRFQSNVRFAVEDLWAPLNEFKEIENFSNEETFETFRQIVRLACVNEIDLQIVLSPVHAYLLVAKEAAGMTELWERWQRAVVETAASEAEISGCKPAPIWDFSGYNEFTSETIANSTSTADSPEWYWDPAHYRKELGDKILNRVFGQESDSSTSDFGLRLTPVNIDERLDFNRRQAINYRAAHADEVALVNETVQDVLRTAKK